MIMSSNTEVMYSLEPSVIETPHKDVEQHAIEGTHLFNTTAQNISWRGITVTVKDRETKQPKAIVDSVEGYVEAGQFLKNSRTRNPSKSLRDYICNTHLGCKLQRQKADG